MTDVVVHMDRDHAYCGVAVADQRRPGRGPEATKRQGRWSGPLRRRRRAGWSGLSPTRRRGGFLTSIQ
jgi:hypothetical protein